MSDSYCYCRSSEKEPSMFRCKKCENYFHTRCLKSKSPSPLEGDLFFNFVCANCGDEEQFTRMQMLWTQVVILTLYNLQLQGSSNCGYYRWRDHICAFIEKNWHVFFGTTKKKTPHLQGTVAGALSSGCPLYFKSGAEELKENGWWTLTDPKPPSIEDIELMNQKKSGKARRQSSRNKLDSFLKTSRLRIRPKKATIQSPIEMNERSSSVLEMKQSNGKQELLSNACIAVDSSCGSWTTEDSKDMLSVKQIEIEPPEVTTLDCLALDWNQFGEIGDSWLTETDLKLSECLPQLILNNEDFDDIEIDPGSMSPTITPGSPKIEDLMFFIENDFTPSEIESDPIYPEIWNESLDGESVESIEKSSCVLAVPNEIKLPCSDTDVGSVINVDHQSESHPVTKRRKKAAQDIKPDTKPEPTVVCQPLTAYEERLLLRKLKTMTEAVNACPEARRLRRKLLMRQEKREWNVPIFDVDAFVSTKRGDGNKSSIANEHKGRLIGQSSSASVPYNLGFHVLDKYHMKGYRVKIHLQQHPSFLNRLVGRGEQQLESIISPYTSRILKPFIWRDYETTPPKLRLLQEIISYGHRNDPDWTPPPRQPIDYSYVRPQHIPIVNALCREFFWPGIDLSGCLQYPDFSCIAMYKWMVIGFAFMDPDVKCDEGYISFLFTHPEWRGTGIATFMIYHLLQTCMGKDVTLHVSPTNPALFLYQKFGFKPEEFILDFYDKYFTADSRECKHAFFLRLPH